MNEAHTSGTKQVYPEFKKWERNETNTGKYFH